MSEQQKVPGLALAKEAIMKAIAGAPGGDADLQYDYIMDPVAKLLANETQKRKTLELKVRHFEGSLRQLASEWLRNGEAAKSSHTKRFYLFFSNELEQAIKKILNELVGLSWVEVE